MAIVEDEVRNESEEENEIEVVVEEDDAEQDSDDSEDDDDERDEELVRKVAELERQISGDPYNYDKHIELIEALWLISELDRWRKAFERLQEMTVLRPKHWVMRLEIEGSLAHTEEDRARLAELFQQATLDCYSVPVLTEWCRWALAFGDMREHAVNMRLQLDEVLRRAGADPLSGKFFWDAKLELERDLLDSMSADDEDYKAQQERVLWCLEEAVSRPLMSGHELLPEMEELAMTMHGLEYVTKVKKQHEVAVDYFQKITPFEDKLLTMLSPEEKCQVYQEYIDTVKELSQIEKYAECDSDTILKVLYDRATTECHSCEAAPALLEAFARHVHARSSRNSYWRVLHTCARRLPRRAIFWTMQMQQAEHEERSFDEVKTIFETALSKGMESYKQGEALWLSYLEYMRRRTAFDNEPDVERARRTFRLAWDSLAEAWGEEANDCEVPLYWARLEYKLMKDPKQGREIFEEIFKYGENKTMSKYWEALVALESARPAAPHKLRELLRRALRSVADYPPAVARLWTDHERDHGQLHTLAECVDACQAKIKEWRESYQAMKDKMTGKNQKGKQSANKKGKGDKRKSKEDEKQKQKRKADGGGDASDAKKKRDADMDVEVGDKDGESSSGVKRSHEDDVEDDEGGSGCSKRQRTESSSSEHRSTTRDNCTLFVSNLEFKVDEQNLRDKLSQYGDIVSLRVRKGIKAFGGSICYCQYKTPDSVDEALKHDRIALDGRPMFFSRYSAKKSKPTFKYSTEAEKNKLFVKNLPYAHCTRDALADIFDKYGKVKDIRVVTFKDGKPKGLAYIEYEDEAAAAEAVAKAHGLLLGERRVDVALSAPPTREPGRPAPSLGGPKRDAGGGMRRTQLSSFIPSVLQKASTSAVASTSNGSHGNGNSNGDGKRPLSNSDFRTLLLKK